MYRKTSLEYHYHYHYNLCCCCCCCWFFRRHVQILIFSQLCVVHRGVCIFWPVSIWHHVLLLFGCMHCHTTTTTTTPMTTLTVTRCTKKNLYEKLAPNQSNAGHGKKSVSNEFSASISLFISYSSTK